MVGSGWLFSAQLNAKLAGNYAFLAWILAATGYSYLGGASRMLYAMAAPISMGALKPKTRIFGLVIFIILGLIMTTMPSRDMLLMNLSIMGLLIVYGLTQLTMKSIRPSALLLLNMPFLAYLWLLYLDQNLIYAGIISALFFLLVSSRGYVRYCKLHKGESAADLYENEGVPERVW